MPKTINELTGSANTAIEEIQKILEQLAAKETSLEEALKALGVGIVSYDYDEATGKVTVLLSNGGTIELMAKDNAVDAVKIMKDEDGKSYWAVGGEFITDANGNKIPVTVTPQVKVDPETSEVSISVDGGATWYATGIIDEEVLPLFLSVESDENYVYFTLADGTKLTVALSTSEIDVVIPARKLYVPYGETRTLDVEMTNVEKFIIVKPEGWRASITDGVLSVTAPAEGVGEAEGYVQIFTVASDGRSAIYEIKVVAGDAPLAISVMSNGTFSISVADGTLAYVYGVAALDGETTLESIYERNSKDWAEGAVKTGAQGGSIAEALGLEELESGKEYVVWAIMLDAEGEGYRAQAFDDMFSEKYVKAEVKITFSDITSVDAKIKIESSGSTGNLLYYIQPLGENVNSWTASEQKQKIDAQIKSATSTVDVLAGGKYEGSLLAWYKEYYMSSAAFVPNHSIFVAVVPEDDKTAEGVMYEIVTLDGYKLGETNASVTFGSIKETYTAVSVRITPAAGTYFRYDYMTETEYKDQYEGFEDDLMTFAIGKGATSGEKKTAQTASPYPVVLGESYIVVVYAYDPATAVGKVFTQKLTCPAITFNETISLSLDVKHTGVNYVEAEIKPAGGEIKSIRYGYMKKADFETNKNLMGDFKVAEEKMVVNSAISQRGNFDAANLQADNLYSIENMYLMEEQYLFVIAFDADDKPVHMQYTLVDTKKPFENGFDADLARPAVKDVYYISNSTGYKQALGNWTRMSEVDDITALDEKSGMYWLDLDWGTSEMKRMWLCNENSQNWTGNYALSETDMKSNAIAVLKKRAGFTASGVAPDFYGRNTTTGARSLTGVVVPNTSEYKTLRNKTTDPYSAKNVYLVWETEDGKYGYMAVTPEDFCPETSGVETWDEGGKIEGWK